MPTFVNRMLFSKIDGKIVEAQVIINQPEKGDLGQWTCKSEVLGGGGRVPEPKLAGGFDSVQALTFALIAVGIALDASGLEWALAPEPFLEDAAKSRILMGDHFPRKMISNHYVPEQTI